MNYLHEDWLYMFIRDFMPMITGIIFIIGMIYIKYTKELDK